MEEHAERQRSTLSIIGVRSWNLGLVVPMERPKYVKGRLLI